MQSSVTRILILGAMDREIFGLRRALAARTEAPLLGTYPHWTAADGSIDIVLTHVGDVDAAIAATAAIAMLTPSIVLKVGCVGGHTAGLHTGDVVIPARIFHSGAWIARTADAAGWQPVFGDLPFQVNRENLGGRDAVLRADDALTAAWAQQIAANGMHGVRAHIGSSNMWFFDQAHMLHVLHANLPEDPVREWAADMESYAVARACAVAGVPFTGIYRAANSEYFAEPYEPAAVKALFDGEFAQAVTQFVARCREQPAAPF